MMMSWPGLLIVRVDSGYPLLSSQVRGRAVHANMGVWSARSRRMIGTSWSLHNALTPSFCTSRAWWIVGSDTFHLIRCQLCLGINELASTFSRRQLAQATSATGPERGIPVVAMSSVVRDDWSGECEGSGPMLRVCLRSLMRRPRLRPR
jgi:hypothetical protein